MAIFSLQVLFTPCALSASALCFRHSTADFHSLQARVQGLMLVHSQVSRLQLFHVWQDLEQGRGPRFCLSLVSFLICSSSHLVVSSMIVVWPGRAQGSLSGSWCSLPVLWRYWRRVSGGSFLVSSWLWQGSGASVAPGIFPRIGRRAATACLGVVRVAKANPVRLLVRWSVGTLILVTGQNFPNSVSMSSSVVE